MLNSLLETIGEIIKVNIWLAPVLAIIAGLLTSFTPCCLSSIPLIIGYVGGTGIDPKRAFRLSLVFVAGSAATFTALGITASMMGNLIGVSSKWWYIALGVLMVLMALQTWEIFQFIPSSYLLSKNTKRGYAGAFFAGILGGIFSSPCSTPVLIVLLAVVSVQGNILWGAFLLLLYAIGHGVLALIAGTSSGIVRKLLLSDRYGRFSKILKISTGIIVLLFGFYMFYLGF